MDIVLEMLAYELAAIFAILSIWLILRNNKKSKTTHEMASKAVKTLKSYKEVRIEKLTSILAEKYALTNGELSLAAIEFQDREQQIYKTLLTLFVEQNGQKLLTISEQLEKAVDASLALLPEQSFTEEPIDNQALTLSEQIEAAAQQLEMLMVFFRQESNGRAIKLQINEAGFDSKISVLYVDYDANNTQEDTITAFAENEERLDISVGENLDQVAEQTHHLVEIDLVENEELFDDLTSNNSVEKYATESVMSVEDVDTLLSSMNDELQAENVFDSIDLSAMDDREEIEEQTPTIYDDELVIATTDYLAASTSDIPTELDITAEIVVEPELVIESELAVEPEVVVEPELAVEPEIAVESEPEIAAVSHNKLSDYFNSEWNNTVPDIYGKTAIQTELEQATEITDSSDIEEQAETAQPLVQNRMSDYFNSEWNNIVPDIYGKTVIQTELEQTEITDNRDLIEKAETAQPSVLNKMSDYIKGNWNSVVPDIYGKAIAQAESEHESEFEDEVDTEIAPKIEIEAQLETENEPDLDVALEITAEPELESTLEVISKEEVVAVESDVVTEPEVTELTTEKEDKIEVELAAEIEPEVAAESEVAPEVAVESDVVTEPEVIELTTEKEDKIEVELAAEIEPEVEVESDVIIEPEVTELTTEIEHKVEAELTTEIESEVTNKPETEIVLNNKAEVDTTSDVENHAITESQFDTEEAMLMAMMTQLDLSEAEQIPANDLNIWDEQFDEPTTELAVLTDKISDLSIDSKNQIEGEAEPVIKTDNNVESVVDKKIGFDAHLPQPPLPDEDTLNELLADVWQLETESKELNLNNAELVTDTIVEPEPEPEPEPELKPKQVIVDAEYALSDMMMDLTAEPVASDIAFKKTMAEVTQLQQKQTNKPKNVVSKHDELQSILSNIPSFTEMNKKN